MAKQTEIAYEPTKEWQDFQTGGTRIDAADLNNMENGIADACAAVDQLRTKRLPTYLVATGGDEATQDVYQEAILGPCLIVDLATATTYYDNGEDGEGHERKKLTSGADIDDLRDSLSQTASDTGWTSFSGVSGSWRVIGRVLYLRFVGSSFAFGDTSVATLPESFRPSVNVDAMPVAMTDLDVGSLYVGVYTDGDVRVHNGSSAPRNVWTSVCLPL